MDADCTGRFVMLAPAHIRRLYVVATLGGSLLLFGCPKHPEIVQAGPGALGPSAATSASPAPASAMTKTTEVPVTRPTPPEQSPLAAMPPAEQSGASVASAGTTAGLQDVFFDFDTAQIRPDQRQVLGQDVEWLRAHPQAKLNIQGNCDERGTPEYNLGLGERRAERVKEYLMAEGVVSERISTVSFGSEHPFVPGHDESAWKQNRRDHLVATP
jgi:peptidoglycan-associated lipoprotein